MESDFESEDYSSEEEISRHKFCDVTLPKDFDPTKQPSTGEEYLQHVMYEAKNCKSTVTANIDYSKFTKNQTYTITLNEGCAKAPQSLLPSPQWQDQKIAEFTQFRKYIEHQLKHVVKNYDTDAWKTKLKTEYPSFSYLSRVGVSTHLTILSNIVDQLSLLKNGAAIDDQLGKWILALLSVIDVPVSPDICYILRELAKQCARIRSKLSNDTSEEKYTNLNFFICIIAVYFKQFDLSDQNKDL